MLFDSPAYFIFLIPVVLIYWRLNRQQQNVFLLLASYLFLRLVGLALSCADDLQHDRGFSDCAEDFCE